MKLFLKNKHLKEQKFVVPENYFESLTEKTLKKAGVTLTPTVIQKTQKRHSIAPLWYSAAASILFVIASGWYFLSQNQNKTINELYYSSIEYSIGEFSTNTLSSYIDERAEIKINEDSESLLYEIEENSILEIDSNP